MKTPNADILLRILYVLHEGLSDLRYLARDGKHEQASDLADTLENIPGFLANWKDEHIEQIEKQLRSYQSKYNGHGRHNYAKYLFDEKPPELF